MSGNVIAQPSDYDDEGGEICDDAITLEGVLQYIREQATDDEVLKIIKMILKRRTETFVRYWLKDGDKIQRIINKPRN